MKKIDLHIHTEPSPFSDRQFVFSIDALHSYIGNAKLDCIAITNHNLFNLNQFSEIQKAVSIPVFPGIEIDLEGGHLLLIGDNVELVDFDARCKQVTKLITAKGDAISVEQLTELFPDLGKYILIPHYEKGPNISEETQRKLEPHITAGEVSSARKFKYCYKDSTKLTPVIFSDARITSELKDHFPTRQTFIDLGEITLKGIKSCLTDKAKVSLTENDGNNFFQVTDDGLHISTGLNVILGERSTGKTFTLERITNSVENVKYIRQFSLLKNDEEKFKQLLATRHSTVSEDFFREFKEVVEDVAKVDTKRSRIEVEKYLSTLLKFAADSDSKDAFAKAKLFSESLFIEANLIPLTKLIEATQLLIENSEYSDIIQRNIGLDQLKKLVVEFMQRYQQSSETNMKRRWINDLVKRITEELRQKTAISPPAEVNFYELVLENEKIKKFIKVVDFLKKEKEIDRKEVRGFKVTAKTKRFAGAQHLKSKSGKNIAFTNAFNSYGNPLTFLNQLKDIDIPATDYHKYFVDIEYKTLNKHNFEVSGGERAEFNLLHEIRDALHYDLLLIDEPESSFDNIFLKNDVNELLKDLSRDIPIVVVTLNNTVGASIKPDFIIYTQRIITGSGVKYKIYKGYPSDKVLTCSDNTTIDNYEVLLSCLEAGQVAYTERRTNTYEILKD